ncbi:MAG: hypothetical protein K6T73_07750 [Candidatus Bathyarchaeota archaeon]|nr:hypothetical protein [Candidatus Bathyarchaeota archaeon]
MLKRLIQKIKDKFKKPQTFPTAPETSVEKPVPKAKTGRSPTYRRISKPSAKAVHKDISRFMKHRRIAPWYRKSIKAKVKPEEVEEKWSSRRL